MVVQKVERSAANLVDRLVSRWVETKVALLVVPLVVQSAVTKGA